MSQNIREILLTVASVGLILLVVAVAINFSASSGIVEQVAKLGADNGYVTAKKKPQAEPESAPKNSFSGTDDNTTSKTLEPLLDKLAGEQKQLRVALNMVNAELVKVVAERNQLRQQLALSTQQSQPPTTPVTTALTSTAPATATDQSTTAIVDNKEQLAQKVAALDSSNSEVLQQLQTLRAMLTENQQQLVKLRQTTVAQTTDETLLQAMPTTPPEVAKKGVTVNTNQPALDQAKPLRLGGIFFALNSAELSAEERQKAQQLVATLKQQPLAKLTIVGYTDTSGDPQHNLVLSKRRAQAVANYLVKLGIPENKIQVVGKGEGYGPEPTPDGVKEPLNRCVGILANNNIDSGLLSLDNNKNADEEIRVRLQEIFFANNSTTISAAERSKIEQIWGVLKQKQPKKLKLIGHSDTKGSPDYNRVLSHKRAQAVAKLLVDLGYPGDKIEVIGSGEAAPPQVTADSVAEPLNRCVGIVAVN